MKKIILPVLIVLLFVAGFFLLKNKSGNTPAEDPAFSVSPTAGQAVLSSPTPGLTPKVSQESSVPADDVLITEMQKAFAAKYSRPVDDFILTVSKKETAFAKGQVSFKGEMGGGLWFGAKTENGWELVFDGNGIMGCEIADKYSLPNDMVPGCADMQNGGEVIQR